MYKHGVYGIIADLPLKQTDLCKSVPVYVGTAPVHLANSENVNRPVLVKNMAEAINKLGYSDDWDKYTLCEAMKVHFDKAQIGPVIFINVYDPAKHKGESKSVKQNLTNEKYEVANAEDCIISTIKLAAEPSDSKTYEAGKDYKVEYDVVKKKLIIRAIGEAKLPGTATISYEQAKAETVKTADIIGTTDNAGNNTGLYAVQDVYQTCEIVPSVLLAPGFSHIKEVKELMSKLSKQLNGHWELMYYSDIPLNDGKNDVTFATAAKWKDENGYNDDNQKVFYPMWIDESGKKYHLSTLYMANKQLIDRESDNVPYQSASNTAVIVPGKLYLGDNNKAVINDTLINDLLNANGITSARFIGTAWVLWGTHTAGYGKENASALNLHDTSMQMLHYICNDFQARRINDIDKPFERNRSAQIAAEEQARLDALVGAGALSYGKVYFSGYDINDTDLIQGDFNYKFEITTYPLVKSLSANINYSPDGLKTIFEEV